MKKRHKRLKIFAILVIVFCLFILLCISVLSVYTKKNISFLLDESLFTAAKSGSITKFYYDSSGSPFSEIEKYQPAHYSDVCYGDYKKDFCKFDDISQYLKDGFIAMEDRGFFEHKGIDLKRTGGAILNYFFGNKRSFGGSTITQQVIKNISGDNDRTLKRKFNEAIRAYHIEYSHSKEEIFELYLNIVPMGENIIGVGYASRCFFGKEPSELSIAEAATLVGIANAPTKYSPYNHKEACKSKRNTVLNVMLQTEKITESEYKNAVKEDLIVQNFKQRNEQINSWFVETVCEEIIDDLTAEYSLSRAAARMLVTNGGLSVYTTVDPLIQQRLERYFENEQNFPQAKELEFSMVINDSVSGDLRAVVGAKGKKYANRIMNMATVPRAPGSSLKPIALYAPLIESGRVTWSSVFDDVPISITESKDGKVVEFPHNYPDVYDGPISVFDALRLSKNTVAVSFYNMIGAKKIFDNLKYNYGFDTLVEKKVLPNQKTITDLAPSPLALGQLSYGVSLRTMTNAYTVFSCDGNLYNQRSYVAVFDSMGKLIIKKEKTEKNIMSSQAARLMLQMLMGVTDSGTASKITLKEIVDVAGKTGTSGNDKDRWFFGVTPYYTAGIWCGYKNMESSVGNNEKNHLKIWDDIMVGVHSLKIGYEDNIRCFSTEGLVYAPYCRDSGKAFSPECLLDERGSRLEYGYFLKGSEPRQSCDKHALPENPISFDKEKYKRYRFRIA